MTAWADDGADGDGEPLAILLRPGNAGSVRHEVAQVEWIRQNGRLMPKVVIPGANGFAKADDDAA